MDDSQNGHMDRKRPSKKYLSRGLPNQQFVFTRL